MTNILKLWVYDRPGVLDTISGMIRRRGVNISTITASEIKEGMSHITISIKSFIDIEKLSDYLNEMSFIKKWEVLKPETHLLRQCVLFKINKKDKDKFWREGMIIIEEMGDYIFIKLVETPKVIVELVAELNANEIESTRSGILGLKYLGDDL